MSINNSVTLGMYFLNPYPAYVLNVKHLITPRDFSSGKGEEDGNAPMFARIF